MLTAKDVRLWVGPGVDAPATERLLVVIVIRCNDQIEQIEAEAAARKKARTDLGRFLTLTRRVRNHAVGLKNELERTRRAVAEWPSHLRDMAYSHEVASFEKDFGDLWNRYAPVFGSLKPQGRQPAEWLPFARHLYREVRRYGGANDEIHLGGKNDPFVKMVAEAVRRVYDQPDVQDETVAKWLREVPVLSHAEALKEWRDRALKEFGGDP